MPDDRQFFTALLDASDDGILVIDEGRNLVHCNRWMAERAAFDQTAVVGDRLESVMPALCAVSGFATAIAACESSGQASRMSESFDLGAAGAGVWNIEVRPVAIGGGRRFCLIRIDVGHGGKQTEAGEKEERGVQDSTDAQYSGVFELIPEAVYVHADDRILFANVATATLFGYASSVELVGLPATTLVHPDQHEHLMTRRRQVFETGEAGPIEQITYVRADGTDFFGEGYGTPIPWGGRQAMLVIVRDMTGREQARRALAESEDRYRRLVELSDDAVFISVKTKIVFVNSAAVDLFGASKPEDLIGLTSVDLVHPDEREAMIERTKRAMAGQIFGNAFIEHRLRLDGTDFSAEVLATPITWENQTGVVVVSRDITERLRAEKALKESEERLRRLADNVPGTVYQRILHPDGSFSFPYMNEGLYDVAGVRPEKAQADPSVMIDLIHPEDEPGYREKFLRSAETMEPTTADFRIVLESGEIKWLRSISRPSRLEDGSVLWDALALDITDQKRAEQLIRESDETARALLNSITESAVLIDRDLTVLAANHTLAERWNTTPEEMIGRSLYDVAPDSIRDERRILWQAVLDAGEPADFELELPGRWIHNRYIPILDESGRATRLAMFVEDITDRKLFQQQLEEAKEAAEAANRAKSNFLATMSHEIRTPMNGILGMAGLMLNTKLDEEQSQFVEVIQDSGESLLALFNDILDFSKMEAGRMELDVAPLELPDLLTSVSNLIRAKADEKGLAFKTEMDPGTPASFRADFGKLRQILLNLVSNAVKFTEHGSVDVTVRADRVADGTATLRFAVRDTGIGIARDIQPKLFNRFTQADVSMTRKFGGTGLGLAICKELCQLMRGRIGVDSEPGKGSTFWFTVELDLAPRQKPAAPIAEAPKTTPEAATAGGTLDILLAEDNLVNQQVGVAMLRIGGHRVDVVATGVEAIDAVREKTYDLVLMDVHMPEMDGVTATKAIRALDGEKSKIPIIAITANAMMGDREAYIAEGMDDYVSKPIDSSKLAAAISRACKIETTLRKVVKNDPVDQENAGKSTIPDDHLSDLMGKLDGLRNGTD